MDPGQKYKVTVKHTFEAEFIKVHMQDDKPVLYEFKDGKGPGGSDRIRRVPASQMIGVGPC